MPNWKKSMKQTFEFYEVDPSSWVNLRKLDNVKSCKITRDLSSETISSASLSLSDTIGECYVRVYLVTTQNSVTERFSMGVFLVQTPTLEFNGKSNTISVDAYSPMTELKEKYLPIGYSILKGANIISNSYDLIKSYTRTPCVNCSNSKTLTSNYISDSSETVLEYVMSLVSNANYYLDLDEDSKIIFTPITDTAALAPVWTFDDSNSSILYSDIELEQDIYGIPNVIEVYYSSGINGAYHATVKNEDLGSPLSIPNRGREIVYRTVDPDLTGIATQADIDTYAQQLLDNSSSIQYTISFSHGYCPVRLGDCVRLNCPSIGLNGVKAKITKQSISCEPGCPVDATATFTDKDSLVITNDISKIIKNKL